MAKLINGILVISAILVAFVLFEVFLSFCMPIEPPSRPHIPDELKAYLKEGIPAYYPNQKGYGCYDLGDGERYGDMVITVDGQDYNCIAYAIGESGFRTPAYQKEKHGFRICVFGDSFSFGEGVKLDDTYPRLIERKLGLETINLAMQGLNTHWELALLKKKIALSPDLVIIDYFFNDTMPIKETINIVDLYESAFDVPPLIKFSKLASIVYTGYMQRRANREMLTKYQKWFDASWHQIKLDFLAMQEICRKYNSDLLVLIFPLLYRFDHQYPLENQHRALSEFLDEANIDHIDLLDAFQRYKPETLWVHKMDHHPNAMAHRVVYTEVQKWLGAHYKQLDITVEKQP